MNKETKQSIFALLGGLIFVSLITGWLIYSQLMVDEDLSDAGKWKKIQLDFENEFKEINLPPKTAVNSFENMSKRRTSVFLTTLYRTELDEEEFVSHISEELSKKGWIYYGKNRDGGYNFCRGKFDAALYYNGSGGIFGDGANYYKLHFILGLRVNNKIPDSCK